MNEGERSYWTLFNKRVKRRAALQAAAGTLIKGVTESVPARTLAKPLAEGTLIAATTIATETTDWGFTLKKPRIPDHISSSVEDAESLSSSSPVTIAHRYANNLKDMEKVAENEIDFADGDLTKPRNGKLYFHHGEFKTIGPFTVGGVDVDTLSLQLGAPEVTAEKGMKKAGELGIGIVLQVKNNRGNFNESDMRYLQRLAKENNVPLHIFSLDYDYVEMVKNATGSLDIPMWSPDSEEDWDRFSAEQDEIYATGYSGSLHLLTNSHSFKAERHRIDPRTKVFVGDVTTPLQALDLQKFGVAGYLNKLPILNAILKPS